MAVTLVHELREVYHQGQRRARGRVMARISALDRRFNSGRTRYSRAYKVWQWWEYNRLVSYLNRRRSLMELAAIMQRPVGGVIARLVLLGVAYHGHDGRLYWRRTVDDAARAVPLCERDCGYPDYYAAWRAFRNMGWPTRMGQLCVPDYLAGRKVRWA